MTTTSPGSSHGCGRCSTVWRPGRRPRRVHHRPRPRDQRASAHRRVRRSRHAVLAELRGRGLHARDLFQLGLGPRRGGRGAGLTGTVDVMVSSAWVGARKPHARIYDAHARPTRRRPRGRAVRRRHVELRRRRPARRGLRPRLPPPSPPRRRHTAPADHHDAHRRPPRRPTSAASVLERVDVTRRSVDGAVVAFPVGGAQLALEHLHRARQRERLGAELDGLRHLVAGDPTRGCAR